MRIRRREPGQERTSLKHSTRAQGHRVTLTAAPRELSLQQRRALRETPPRPPGHHRQCSALSDRADPRANSGRSRMAAPLGGFAPRVNRPRAASGSAEQQEARHQENHRCHGADDHQVTLGRAHLRLHDDCSQSSRTLVPPARASPSAKPLENGASPISPTRDLQAEPDKGLCLFDSNWGVMQSLRV